MTLGASHQTRQSKVQDPKIIQINNTQQNVPENPQKSLLSNFQKMVPEKQEVSKKTSTRRLRKDRSKSRNAHSMVSSDII